MIWPLIVMAYRLCCVLVMQCDQNRTLHGCMAYHTAKAKAMQHLVSTSSILVAFW